MTHPQEQNSEWIEHDGKSRPDFDAMARVSLKFRDGEEWEDAIVDDFHACWKFGRHPDDFDAADIVAYRLHTPTPSSQGDAQ